MIRSLPATRSPTRSARLAPKAIKPRVFLGLRALVAFLIATLQLASALHFTLVPHTFSASLGGVVHVHGASERSQARAEPRVVKPHVQARMFATGSPSCAVDLCPFADAPHGSPACVAATVSGVAAFGAPALLSKAEARSPLARRVFLGAPKTSPPV